MTAPNVVVFLTDQQRYDTMGLAGNPLDLTPNLDRFAATGTFCPDAFTNQPVCAPARAMIQTGRYPTQIGVYRNGIPLPTDATTIAHRFAAAGYDTAYVGKWHLAGTDDRPVPPEARGGYDHWVAADVVEFLSDAYDSRLYDADGTLLRLPGYRSDTYVDRAIDYLARPHGKPFLLFVSLIEPHHQNTRDDYPAPDGYRERYEGRWVPPDLAALGGSTHQQLGGYWGMVKRVDEGFGRLLDALRSTGLRDDTVVCYTTDHGCHFKTRNDEYKRSAHDASIRIPLAFNGPGFTGGGRYQGLASLVDLAPTLLAAAGLDHADLPGTPVTAGPAPAEVYVQISESQVGRAIRTARWTYAVRAPGAHAWHDAYADRYVETELYDLAADPYQLANLAGLASHRAVADDLRDRLLARMAAAGEPPATIEPAPARPSGQRRIDPGEH
ncbi:MAG TPA: sulfatase-like hydrolase/transferase [Actinocatenispora sp.]